MTRGAEKKIFYVKNTKSPYFEEVWFILRPSAKGGGTPPSTLAEEAERIIRDTGGSFERRRRGAPIRRFSPSLAFALGAASSSALIGAAALIAALA